VNSIDPYYRLNVFLFLPHHLENVRRSSLSWHVTFVRVFAEQIGKVWTYRVDALGSLSDLSG
jgi:hypothetical protein